LSDISSSASSSTRALDLPEKTVPEPLRVVEADCSFLSAELVSKLLSGLMPQRMPL